MCPPGVSEAIVLHSTPKDVAWRPSALSPASAVPGHALGALGLRAAACLRRTRALAVLLTGFAGLSNVGRRSRAAIQRWFRPSLASSGRFSMSTTELPQPDAASTPVSETAAGAGDSVSALVKQFALYPFFIVLGIVAVFTLFSLLLRDQ